MPPCPVLVDDENLHAPTWLRRHCVNHSTRYGVGAGLTATTVPVRFPPRDHVHSSCMIAAIYLPCLGTTIDNGARVRISGIWLRFLRLAAASTAVLLITSPSLS